MTRTEQFEALRPLLFSIAYRILGSVGEAEDAVQETWLRWEASTTTPVSARAYLSAAVTRSRSTCSARLACAGTSTSVRGFPSRCSTTPTRTRSVRRNSRTRLSTAALLPLERLGPLERAVFVLREVFGFADIAAAVDRAEAACRQLAFRARHVQLVGDSGGKGPQFAERIVGVANVARLLATLVPPFVTTGGIIEAQRPNGQPGAIFRDRDGKVVNTWTLDILDGQIKTAPGRPADPPRAAIIPAALGATSLTTTPRRRD